MSDPPAHRGLPYYEVVVLVALCRDHVHDVLFEVDGRSLSERSPSEIRNWVRSHKGDPTLSAIGFSRCLPIMDKSTFNFAFGSVAVLKPFTETQHAANRHNIDTRLWNIFRMYKFSNTAVCIDLFRRRRQSFAPLAAAVAAAAPAATSSSSPSSSSSSLTALTVRDGGPFITSSIVAHSGTQFERLVYLLLIGKLTRPDRADDSTTAKAARKRAFPSFRVNLYNCNRVAHAVLAIVRAWDVFARIFGFPSIDCLVAPYVIFDHSILLFRVLEREEGYAPIVQSLSLDPACTTSARDVADTYPLAHGRTELCHTVMREVSHIFLSDLSRCILNDSLYDQDGANWVGLPFLQHSSELVLCEAFDTRRDLLVRVHTAVRRGTYVLYPSSTSSTIVETPAPVTDLAHVSVIPSVAVTNYKLPDVNHVSKAGEHPPANEETNVDISHGGVRLEDEAREESPTCLVTEANGKLHNGDGNGSSTFPVKDNTCNDAGPSRPATRPANPASEPHGSSVTHCAKESSVPTTQRIPVNAADGGRTEVIERTAVNATDGGRDEVVDHLNEPGNDDTNGMASRHDNCGAEDVGMAVVARANVEERVGIAREAEATGKSTVTPANADNEEGRVLVAEASSPEPAGNGTIVTSPERSVTHPVYGPTGPASTSTAMGKCHSIERGRSPRPSPPPAAAPAGRITKESDHECETVSVDRSDQGERVPHVRKRARRAEGSWLQQGSRGAFRPLRVNVVEEEDCSGDTPSIGDGAGEATPRNKCTLPPISIPPHCVLVFLSVLWKMPQLLNLDKETTHMWPKEVLLQLSIVNKETLLATECVACNVNLNTSTVRENAVGVFATQAFSAGDVICDYYGVIAYESERRDGVTLATGAMRLLGSSRGQLGVSLPRVVAKWRTKEGALIYRVFIVPFEGCVAANIVSRMSLDPSEVATFESSTVINAFCSKRRSSRGIRRMSEVCETDAVSVVAKRHIEKGEEICLTLSDGADGAKEVSNRRGISSKRRRCGD